MKKCCKCKLLKKEEDFAIHSNTKDGRQTCCRACNTLYCNKRYKRNKELYAEKYRNARDRDRLYILEYLEMNPCVDCGESDPVVLEFDHVRGKKKESISVLMNRAVSIKTLINEINKCDVRCANCHRRKTSEEFGYYRSLKKGFTGA